MDLHSCGPLTTVQLWVPRHVQTTIAPMAVVAEINTAAAQTLLQEGLATSLGLEPAGMTTIATATTFACEVPQYLVRVIFPAAKLAFEVLVAEVPYMLQSKNGDRIRCLIGQDILQYAVLTYNGPARSYSLEFTGYPDER